tara:strand:- start:5838 stop:6029 length:192 start_codon:yes stop_codon:yes gene_type:complete
MKSNKNLEKIYSEDRLTAYTVRHLNAKNPVSLLTNEESYLQIRLSNYFKNIEITKLATINSSI